MSWSREIEICATAVAQLRLRSPWGDLFVAGANQFRTLWVRDFCLSVAGLKTVTPTADLQAVLDLLWQTRDESRDLIVRGLDVLPPQQRVLAVTAGLRLRSFSEVKGKTEKVTLYREFRGEHGTPAFDSNLLWVLASLDLLAAVPERKNEILDRCEVLIEFYRPYWIDFLLQQPAFSDWQDSARRSGSTFYLHLLFWRAVQLLQNEGRVAAYNLTDLSDRIYRHFWHAKKNLFRTQPGQDQCSLEANLWAVNWKFPNAKAQAVQSHFFQPQKFGIPVDEFYPATAISWTTKAVGLRHYHDDFVWSWLWAEQVRFLVLQNQTELAAKSTTEFFRIVAESPHPERGPAEVYRVTSGKLAPVRTLLYRSEAPFLWGASKWLEALAVLQTGRTPEQGPLKGQIRQ